MKVLVVYHSVHGHTLQLAGGTPYGATTIAGLQGELAPAPEDLAICRVQGRRVAELAQKIRA